MDPDIFLQAAFVVNVAAAFVAIAAYRRRRRIGILRRPRRRWGVHPINRNRDEKGHYNNLYMELREHPDRFFKYTRMSLLQFDMLVDFLRADLTKDDTYTKPLPPELRVLCALRYLAQGDTVDTIAGAYRIGISTCSGIIHEVNQAIWRNMKDIYLPEPTEADYRRMAHEFETRWNLPHCVGSIDGKHCVIKCPANSGAYYHCYKGCFSIVLMAACDANYNFTMVDIGAAGSRSDGGILTDSNFGERLYDGDLPLPPSCPLPGTENRPLHEIEVFSESLGRRIRLDQNMPFFYVGDEAFALKTHLMRPFPRDQTLGRSDQAMRKKIFNYRLSRARRIIENTFGILAAKWRVFHRLVEMHEENATNMIKAAVVLHNFVRKTGTTNDGDGRYAPDRGDQRDGAWRAHVPATTCLVNYRSDFSRNFTREAGVVRECLSWYLSKIYTVPWQVQHVLRRNWDRQ